MQPHDALTEEQLQALCLEWQEVLRLQDWDVKVQLKRQRDFRDHTKDAEIYISEDLKTALMYLLDPADYNPSSPWPQDLEDDLVHELVHLHFKPVETKHTPYIPMEQMINALAGALVRLKRRGVSNSASEDSQAGPVHAGSSPQPGVCQESRDLPGRGP